MCISGTWIRHFVEVLTSYHQPETVYYAPASKNSTASCRVPDSSLISIHFKRRSNT